MSQSIFQLKNNEVMINKDNKTYQDTVEYFKTDYPNEFTENVEEIIYNQTLNIYVVDGVPQDVKKDDILDEVIHHIDTLLEKQSRRQPILSEPQQPVAQEHEYVDSSILDLGEAVLELSLKVEKLEGGAKA